MKQKYFSLEELVRMIELPNGPKCLKILDENLEVFRLARGSSHNHQSWQGGYADHVQEVMNIGLFLFDQMSALRPLPFRASDVLLVLFLHDIEKPWKYETVNGELQIKPALASKVAQRTFRDMRLLEYGIKLTSDQENALKYVEGERDDYSPSRRAMGPLAGLCHLADVASARIWFDYPHDNDPWSGAKRNG